MSGKALWGALLSAAMGAPALAQIGMEPANPGVGAAAQGGEEAAIAAGNDEIARLYTDGRFAEALEGSLALLARAERELGPDHPETLLVVNNLAVLYDALGRYTEAEPLYQRAISANERRFGPEHPDTLLAFHNLGALYDSMGRYAEAEQLIQRALAARERVLGAEHPDTLQSLHGLASVFELQGRYAEAERFYLRALAGRDRILGAEHRSTLATVNNLAVLYGLQGRHAEAEPLFVRVLAANERALGPDHPNTLMTLNNLASIYELQGRLAEAERLHGRALATRESILGPEHPDTLASVNNLAAVTERQGRYSEAEPLYLRALAARESVLGTDHPDTLVSIDALAVLYGLQGRASEAERFHRRALVARARILGSEHPATLLSANNLAVVYDSQARYAEADALYSRAIAARRRVLGAEHPDTILTAQALASTKLAAADPQAIEFARAALDLTRRRTRLTGDTRSPQASDQGIGPVAFIHARAVWSDGRSSRIEEAFESLQLVGATSVGRALARSAALATLDRAGQALAIEREDAKGSIAAIDGAIASAASEGGGGEALAELQERRDAVLERIAEIDAALEASNPRFFELIRPEPVPLDALRSNEGEGLPLLKADEALILLAPGDTRFPEGQRRGFAFAVTREGAAWAELPLEPGDLGHLIAEVRDGSAIIDPAFQQPVPRKRAKALYDALFGAPEIAKLIAGKSSWIVSPQGALLTTPFAALVTRDPQGRDDDPAALASTAWLGTERALAILPDVHMLRALRGLERPAGAASAPYFGIADPAFEGKGKKDEVRSAASYFRGAVGSPDAILELAPLPNTRAEVETVAGALGVGPERLLFGGEATEAQLRAHAAQLGDSRVIHFATHALVSGEMGGLTQPALALMPPTGDAAVEEINDGLLTAAEAAALKLNAEWVILSACNTAAGGGDGAEGLSGLARGFFYAGAASLLVSQWQVRDDSGAMLVAEAVKAFAAEEDISRAEALRRAMRTVSASHNAGGESFAHPQDWAPFMLVGVDR